MVSLLCLTIGVLALWLLTTGVLALILLLLPLSWFFSLSLGYSDYVVVVLFGVGHPIVSCFLPFDQL